MVVGVKDAVENARRKATLHWHSSSKGALPVDDAMLLSKDIDQLRQHSNIRENF
jgi:hypothetical protein